VTAAASIRGYADHPKEDHFVRLRGVTWADYQRLLEIRGERASPRMNVLRADRYEAAERSELLPALDLAELVQFLDVRADEPRRA
jgi:hypothetical protein